MVMGCYGIGVSRTMAAAVEQNYDEDGIIGLSLWLLISCYYPISVTDDLLASVFRTISKVTGKGD